MRNAVRLDEAERTIKAVVLDLIDKSAVEHVSVTSGDDATDEPSFFVTVFLRDASDRPSAAKSIDIIRAMRSALFDLGDDRFPHLSFSAPGDEPSEDTRSAE